MTDFSPEEAGATRKGSWLPLFAGGAAALALGAGGFHLMQSGLLPPGSVAESATGGGQSLPDIAYVPVDTLIISLGPRGGNRQLRFAAQIEVDRSVRQQVEKLMPRVVDLLNSYLRAVAVEDLEDPVALVRLRAQILRRVRIVVGEDRVRDFLISEFVLH